MIIFLMAAEFMVTVRTIDVKSKYFQAKRFHRTIFDLPQRKEDEIKCLWQLVVPAY